MGTVLLAADTRSHAQPRTPRGLRGVDRGEGRTGDLQAARVPRVPSLRHPPLEPDHRMALCTREAGCQERQTRGRASWPTSNSAQHAALPTVAQWSTVSGPDGTAPAVSSHNRIPRSHFPDRKNSGVAPTGPGCPAAGCLFELRTQLGELTSVSGFRLTRLGSGITLNRTNGRGRGYFCSCWS